ncbi:hypothetical protein [Nocardioides houyundeii]|uniref:hypothetical protein n=1 Tax=Nocardioides houyundeii TaxID=2045452 RepID=UPI000C769DCB|nr:hypothetical protein [Nocardioides houyundeii]
MIQPRTETVTRVVDPVAVEALAGLLGSHDVDVRAGAPLPALWHWVALSRWPDPESLGPDGHPRRGTGIMPEVDLPRRMFGGGTVRFRAPVPIGSRVTMVSSASQPRHREGRSGRLALVDLTIRVHADDGRLLVEEVQNIVYTEARETGDVAVEPAPAPGVGALLAPAPEQAGAAASWQLRTDPILLARFSALTSNPHRIHLDWPYATRTEGYPGLVVHGPLMATALAEVGRRAGAPFPSVLRHRGSAPLFCGDPAELVRRDEGHPVLEVVSPGDGQPRVHARVELDPPPARA